MKYYIYQIYCTDNEYTYIGQTNNITSRWYRHKKLLKDKKHFNSHLQNCFNKYGINSLKYEIINIVETREDVNNLEILWIKTFKAINKCLNQSGVQTVYDMSEDTKKKISNAHKGRVITYANKIRDTIKSNSEHMIRSSLMGKSRKGIILPKEQVSKSVNTRKERYKGLTDLQRKNRSVSNGFVPFDVISPQGIIYTVNMLKPFCREHHLDQSGLRKLRDSKIKRHKGWIKKGIDIPVEL